MVEIVSIYPVFDVFDLEIDPDEFYNETPDYFEWDDLKSGGVDSTILSTIGQPTACVYRRMD